MASLRIIRKLGERDPVSIKVTYPTSYDLSAAAVGFYLDAPDGTPKVVSGEASVEDITPTGEVPQSVWLLSYTFGADDLSSVGTYVGEFEVDFGGGIKRYYPTKRDVIQVNVVSHPASS